MFNFQQAGSHNPEFDPTDPALSLDPAALRALRDMVMSDPSAHAMWVLKEIERFSTAFPEFSVPQRAIPRFTWEQLERQLMFLAGTPQRQAMVSDRVASIRKCCAHKPEEMILQEILIEAWVLLDEEPHGPLEEEGQMT
jgi:hypothetical protein